MPGQKRKGSVIPSPVDPKKTKSMMSEWSDLPQDLIASMAKKLVSLEDFIIFGAVSKSCRSAAAKSNFTGELRHQVPLVLQFVCPREKEIAYKAVMKNGELVILGRKPEANAENSKQDNESDVSMIELYSLTKNKIYRLNWPPPELPKSKVCCSSLGWLLTVSEGLRFDQLINPFSNAKIELPYGLRYNPSQTLHFVLSASPSSTLNYTIMISIGTRNLFYCRPGLGDQGWNRLELHRLSRWILDMNYFQGRYHLIDRLGLVSAVYDDENQSIMRHVVAPEIPSELLGPMMRVETSYLVESAGDLLVVLWSNKRLEMKSTKIFHLQTVAKQS